MKRKNNLSASGNPAPVNRPSQSPNPSRGSAGRSVARRLLDRILGGDTSPTDSARGRLLLEPLESRQMLAGDVEFLSTDGTSSLAIDAAAETAFSASSTTAEGEAANDLVAFAKALDDAGVTFYGAAWCPFCTDQKELFEDGGDFLPFVEVTNPDRTLNSVGQAEGIQTFPTWVFQDGTRATGVLTLAQLSERSGVPIPQGETPSFAPIGNLSVEVGSPLHIPINAYDPDDSSLTVTVSVANPSLLQASVLTGNRSARISVQGWGDMVFELFEDKAPRPTGRFIELAQSGFYDQTDTKQIIFHRVIDNFVLQAGDPTGTGSGGSTLGDFDDQYHPDLQHNRTGILSYAKSLDDTNDSQFFITEGQQRHLDYNHSIFGQLVEGDAVREAISGTAVTNSRPTNNIVISEVEIFSDSENSVVMLKATGASLGTTDVTITVTDDDGNSFSEVITVTVVADQDNARPYLEDIPPVSTPAGVPAQFQLQGVDVEGDPIVYEARVIDNSGATATVNQSTGLVTVTPAANFSGPIAVEVAARSPNTPTSTVASTRSSTMDLQVVQVNVGPAAPTGVSLIAASDSGVSDSDGITNTAPVTFRVTGVQPGATVEILAGDTQIGVGTATTTTATITTNNFAALGNATHVVTARQTVNGLTSVKSQSINVTYDTVPPANVAAIPVQASVGVVYSANLQSDEEGTGLRYAVVSAPTGLTIDALTGVIAWTPTSEQIGDQAVVVRMTDVAGNSTEQTFSVNVGADPLVNIRLEITDTSGTVINSIAPGQEFRVRVYGDDLRSSLLAQGVFALYTDLIFDPELAVPLETDPFVYEPLYSGVRAGTVGNGRIENVGSISSQTSFLGPGERLVFSVRMRALAGGTFTISADPAEGSGRDIAVFNQDTAVPVSRVVYGSASVTINSSFTVVNDTATVPEDSTSSSIPVLANDIINTPGTTLSLASVQTTSTQGGTVSISGSSVLYTPAANFNGIDTFTYVVRDQAGNQQTGTVSVTVQPVNDPPTAINDSFTAAVNSTLNAIDVLANDSSAPDIGETLRVTAVGAPSRGGTVAIGPNGSNVLYTPANGFIGVETFTYTISDGSLTATATVSVNVGGPTIGNDSFTIAEDAAVAEFNVLANDTAANSNITLSIQSVGTSSNGTASVTSNGTRLSYRPNPNFFGTDTVTYTVVDSNGATATGTVTFTVTGSNDPPPAPNNTVDIVRGTTATTVITVDSLKLLNVDGTEEALTITAVGSTQNGGTVAIGANGQSVTYTPPSSTYTGPDSFTYTVTDAAGSTTTGTLTIDVIDFSPLDFVVQLSNATSFSAHSNSIWSQARLIGTDFRGNAIEAAASFNSTNDRLQFLAQPPGNYEIQIPAMPFLFGREQPITVPISTTVSDTSFDPLSIDLGGLHARFLSIRDFVSNAPRSYVFAAVRPGESQAWMIGTDNANTPENIEVSLSSDGNNLTIEIDDAAVTNGRRSATVPVTTTSMVDRRGEAGGFHLFKITVDQSVQSISSRFTPVTTTSSTTGSGASSTSGSNSTTNNTSSNTTNTGGAPSSNNSAAGEGESGSSQLGSSASPTVSTFTDNSTADADAGNPGFAGNIEAEGEWFGASADNLDSAETEDESVVSGEGSSEFELLSELEQQRRSAVDSAMLDLLPALQLRSGTADQLASADDNEHPQNVDESLKLLDE